MGFPDPETLAIFERFSLMLRQGGGLPIRGRPLPRGDAAGLDFEGFAEYTPGMDLRHLDWRIYARTRELCVRRFADEGAGVLAVLADASGSMALGEPPKWHLARALAGALVFAGLREVHEVLLGIARGPRLETLPLTGGISFAATAFERLAAQVPEGPTDLGAALGALPTGYARGDAVVISDFLDPLGAERGLVALATAGWSVDVCRVESVEDRELPPPGASLFDPEGTTRARSPRAPAERARLQAALDAHRMALDRAATRHGAVRIDLDAAAPLPVALTRYFSAVAAARRGRATRR